MKKSLFIFFLFSSQLLFSQGTEIGLFGGLSFYSGDLTAREFGIYLKELHPAYGAFVRFHPLKGVGVRLAFNKGEISGNDDNSNYTERGLTFRSDILEGALSLEIEALRLSGAKGDNYAAFYLFGGAGLTRFDPETFFEDSYIKLQPIGTEGQGLPGYEEPYNLTQFNIPLGLGFKFVINRQVAIGLEFGGRRMFTDYLDDIGSAQVNYDEMLQGKGVVAAQISFPNWEALGSPPTFRRGGNFNDWYFMGGLTISYFLNGGHEGSRPKGKSLNNKCPQSTFSKKKKKRKFRR